MIVRDDYARFNYENDLAIIEMDYPVEYKLHILPICLPTMPRDYVGEMAYVTGWGRTNYNGIYIFI